MDSTVMMQIEYAEPTGIQTGGLYRLTQAPDGTPAYSMKYDAQATQDAAIVARVRGAIRQWQATYPTTRTYRIMNQLDVFPVGSPTASAARDMLGILSWFVGAVQKDIDASRAQEPTP